MALQLAEILSRVRSQLNDPSQLFFNNTEIVNYANDWLFEVANHTDAFVRLTPFETVASTRLYTMTADYLRTERMVWNATTVLPGVTHDRLYMMTADVNRTGTPQIYYVERDSGVTASTGTSPAKIGLYPVPTLVRTVTHFYHFVPAPLTAMTHVMPLPRGYDESCVPYVCWQLKKKDRESGEAERYKKEYEESLVDALRMLDYRPDVRRVMLPDTGEGDTRFAIMDPAVFERP